MLKDNTSNREFNDQSQACASKAAQHTRPSCVSVKQVNKTTVMTRILQLVHEICTKGIHVTKRDLFYTDVKLFEARAHVCAACCTLPDSVCPAANRTRNALTLCSTTSPACLAARGRA